MSKWCVVVAVLTAACTKTSTVICELGAETWTCPAGALCDPARVGCLEESQLHGCDGTADGTACTIGSDGLGVCETGICEVSRCGDTFVVPPEECEPATPGPESSCTFAGYYKDVIAPCKPDCTIDYATGCVDAQRCGDNVINGPELCDGAPPAQTCVDVGYAAGFLACSNGCGPGLEDCKLLSWTSRVLGGSGIAVDGASDTDVFTVGLNPLVVAHYNGVTWTEIDTSLCVPAGDRFTFLGVHALGGGKALLAGGEGLASTNSYPDAVAVTVDTSASPPSCTRTVVGTAAGVLADVWPLSASDIWASGRGFFHFDGTSWTSTNTNLSYIPKLWAAAPDNIYAAAATDGLWHYNGTSWSAVSGVTGTINAVTGTSATDVYVGGPNGYRHWNGTAWSALLSPGLDFKSLTTDTKHVYAGTATGVFVLDGSTWSTLGLPTSFFPTAYGVWASTQGAVFATAGSRIARYPGGALSAIQLSGTTSLSAAADQNVAYLLNNGALDVVVGSYPHQDSAAPAHSPSSYGAMWRDPTTGIVYFAQAGTGASLDRWTPGATPMDQGAWATKASIPGSIAMWGTSISDLWLVPDNAPTTFAHFSGTTVDATCASCQPGGTYLDIWGAATNSVFAVGQNGAIARFTTTWTTMTSGTNVTLVGVWGFGPNDVYAFGDNTFLHFDGTTWSPLSAPPGTAQRRALWGAAGNDMFASTTAGVFHFDGIRWAPVNVSNDRVVTIRGAGDAIFFTDDNNLAHRLVRTLDWSN